MPNTIKIMVADDHDPFRKGFSIFLRDHGFTVIGDARTGIEFTRLINPLYLPDIAIISYKTRNPQTLDTARWVKEHYPAVKVVISTLFPHHLPIGEFRQIGIEGLIIKSQGKQIIKVLQSVYWGECCYSASPDIQKNYHDGKYFIDRLPGKAQAQP